jgi:hypothetical protein
LTSANARTKIRAFLVRGMSRGMAQLPRSHGPSPAPSPRLHRGVALGQLPLRRICRRRPADPQAQAPPRDREDVRRSRSGADEASAPAITVRQAVAQWLEVAELAATTRERYEDLIRLYVLFARSQSAARTLPPPAQPRSA